MRRRLLTFALCAGPALAQITTRPGARRDQTPVVISESGGFLDRLFSVYRPKSVAEVSFGNSDRLRSLTRAGNIYLSLGDAVALGIENNLDVEFSRFNPRLAATDTLRSKGGGTLRGVLLTAYDVPAGVGGPVSPLLNIAASAATPSTSVANSLLSPASLNSTQNNLSVLGSTPLSTSLISNGPPLPQFDPSLNGSLSWTHQTTLQTSTVQTGTDTLVANSTLGNLGLQQGFSTGTSFNLGYNNTTQTNLNSVRSLYSPYSVGSLGLTVTQPLLRGRGGRVNRRFIRIAENSERISELIFQQQLINTVYGVTRIYYDLVALNEDARVKRETLAAAERLLADTRSRVEEGTLAPVEQTRAQAQVAGARQDLINSEGLLQEQEAIVKNVLTREGFSDPGLREARLVPTEAPQVPERDEVRPEQDLLQEAFTNRPDLQQNAIQITNYQISLEGSRNALLPQIDLFGTAQNSGLTGEPNARLNTGAGGGLLPSGPDAALTGGYGNLLGQIFGRNYPTYGGGIQVNLPLRNRVAQADQIRDELQLRQSQVRLRQTRNQAQLEIEDALIALRRSRAAYEAAAQTRTLQEQSLSVEQARLEAGVSTPFFVIQYQSYLAQARSTELVARSNYFKARAALDRALGATLRENNISVDEAYRGQISRPSTLPDVLPAAPSGGPGGVAQERGGRGSLLR